jgi:hypothetical protein
MIMRLGVSFFILFARLGSDAVWGPGFASGHAFRRAAEAATYARFSGRDGQGQRLKPFRFLYFIGIAEAKP